MPISFKHRKFSVFNEAPVLSLSLAQLASAKRNKPNGRSDERTKKKTSNMNSTLRICSKNAFFRVFLDAVTEMGNWQRLSELFQIDAL